MNFVLALKIMFWILNFVLTLKIMFWILNFVLVLKIMFCILNFVLKLVVSNFLKMKNNVLILIMFLEPYRPSEASLVQN